MPVNERGIIAHEKERRFRLIFGSSQTASKIFEGPASRNVIVESDGRARTIGNHTIDPNMIGRELYSHGSRHVDDARLGRSICDTISPSDQAGRRAEVNDLSSASLLCHLHRDVSGSGVVAVGPELSGRHLAAEYLQRFLADPSITGSANRMPNLSLKPTEIAALIAFLNKPEGQTGAGN